MAKASQQVARSLSRHAPMLVEVAMREVMAGRLDTLPALLHVLGSALAAQQQRKGTVTNVNSEGEAA